MIRKRAICGNRLSFSSRFSVLQASAEQALTKEPTETLYCFAQQWQLHVDTSRPDCVELRCGAVALG